MAKEGQKAVQGQLQVGEYGWAEPGTRPVEPNLKSLQTQINEVKSSGMEYVKISYLISSLNVKDGTCNASIPGNCAPSYTLADDILDTVLKAGLKPIVYFSQGNPDPKTVKNANSNQVYMSVPSFTKEQVNDAISHVVQKFANRGVIWESWNEPDSEEHWPGGRSANMNNWIELDRFIAQTVHHYDPHAAYIFGNMSDGGQLRQHLNEAQTEGATAVSSHGYWFAAPPENAQGPAVNNYAFMDSEFGCSGNDSHPTETSWSCGFNNIPKDHRLQGIWLDREFLAKDRKGDNIYSPYRLIGYDSFNINESDDPAHPEQIVETAAFREIKDLTLALKGYSYASNVKDAYQDKNGIAVQLYRNANGDEKAVYWKSGTPTLKNDQETVRGTISVDGVQKSVVAQPLPQVVNIRGTYRSVHSADMNVKAGTSVQDFKKSEPSSVQVTTSQNESIDVPVAWNDLTKSDANILEKGGSFTLTGSIAGSKLVPTLTVTVTAHHYSALPNRADRWETTGGDTLQAHGGSIIQAPDGTFYWVGQGAPDNVPVPNAKMYEYKNQWLFTTINMYSSRDLMNWKAEKPVLSLNDSNDSPAASQWCNGNDKKFTGSQPTAVIPQKVKNEWPAYNSSKTLGCKIERPHIIYNQKNKEYLVWAHWEGTVGYESSQLIAASAKSPTGPWHVIRWADGQYHEQPTVNITTAGKVTPTKIASRDLSVWVDPDTQKGYLISVFGGGLRLYHLSDDYKSIDPNNSFVLNIQHSGNGLEAPSLFKENGKYYLFASHQDWWNPTATDYAVSTNIDDPNSWTKARQIQSRSDAWNNAKYIGQPTYVLQYKDAHGKPAVLLIGDNWNPLHKATKDVDTSIGRYVFTPVTRYSDGTVSVPIVQSVVPMEAGIDVQQVTEVLPNGTYRFDSHVAARRTLDVRSGSHANGANVRLWQTNGSDAQAWYVRNNSDHTVTITNAGSGKILDADKSGHQNVYSGSNVQQWDNGNNLNQRWIPVKVNGGIELRSAAKTKTPLTLDVQSGRSAQGTNVRLWAVNNSKAQVWNAVKVLSSRDRTYQLAANHRADLANGTYRIISQRGSFHVVDVRAASHANGANVRIWDANGTDAQVWTVRHDANGFISLFNAESGKILDADKSGHQNVYSGSNVQQWDNGNNLNQKWIAMKTNRGAFELVNGANTSLCLDLQAGRTANGTNIRLWEANHTPSQRWTFARATTSVQRLDQTAAAHRNDLPNGTYTFLSALADNRAMDLQSGSHADGANVRLWDDNKTTAQKWIVRHDAKGYITLINARSGKALDVDQPQSLSHPVNGANIHQWDNANTRNQKWIALKMSNGSFVLISAADENHVVDVASGNTRLGTNIRLWERNNSRAQRWFIR